jgi:hypothetical protein
MLIGDYLLITCYADTKYCAEVKRSDKRVNCGIHRLALLRGDQLPRY